MDSVRMELHKFRIKTREDKEDWKSFQGGEGWQRAATPNNTIRRTYFHNLSEKGKISA